MLVPHFQFSGHCEEAIRLYEKVFNTKVDTIQYNKELGGAEDDMSVGHAEMHIHGQRVMMNDKCGGKGDGVDSTILMVMVFKTKEQLMQSYDIIKDGINTIDPLQEVFYSPLVTVFVDKFGVQWCFMVDEEVEQNYDA